MNRNVQGKGKGCLRTFRTALVWLLNVDKLGRDKTCVKLRKSLSKFYYCNHPLISKYKCNFKSLMRKVFHIRYFMAMWFAVFIRLLDLYVLFFLLLTY